MTTKVMLQIVAKNARNLCAVNVNETMANGKSAHSLPWYDTYCRLMDNSGSFTELHNQKADVPQSIVKGFTDRMNSQVVPNLAKKSIPIMCKDFFATVSDEEIFNQRVDGKYVCNHETHKCNFFPIEVELTGCIDEVAANSNL